MIQCLQIQFQPTADSILNIGPSFYAALESLEKVEDFRYCLKYKTKFTKWRNETIQQAREILPHLQSISKGMRTNGQ